VGKGYKQFFAPSDIFIVVLPIAYVKSLGTSLDIFTVILQIRTFIFDEVL